MAQNEPHKQIEHKTWEDALAFLVGTASCALAVQFLTHLDLITGQTAGLGVLLSYVLPYDFGTVFFVVNLPFYVLGYLRLGLRFTVKSFIAVALMSGMTKLFPSLVEFGHVNPAFGAAMAGVLAGTGLLVLFRHGASLGGVGVLGLWLQERAGIQAGVVQLGFDAVLFLCALFVLPLEMVGWSLLGAVITNLIIALNHRQDRYVAR